MFMVNYALITFAFVISSQQLAIAPESNKQHSGPTSQSQVSLSDFEWLAGHWQGEGMDGTFEETWNKPFGGSMMCMFKFVQDSQVVFYELVTIVEEDGKFLLRLKHFDKGLVGWEAKEKSIEFPLVSVSNTEAIFEGLKYIKVNDSTMHIFVHIKQGEKVEEIKFVCRKQTDK